MGLKRAWWLAVVSLVMITAGTPAYAGQEQVSVCHLKGQDSYQPVSVAASAVAAHLKHGDALPGEAVPATRRSSSTPIANRSPRAHAASV
jgi:hypothetical protein